MHVERLRMPESLDSPDAAEFLEYSALSDAIQQEIWGNQDRCASVAHRLGVWQRDRTRRTVLFFVRRDGAMVGRAFCQLPLEDSVDQAMVRAEVLEAWSGRGIGRVLLDAAMLEAEVNGRTRLTSFTEHRPGFAEDAPGARRSPVGLGALPADSRAADFAEASGFVLGQVTRFSSLDLQADGVDERLASLASLADSDGYEVLLWDRVPEEYLEGMARLHARMSIDAPQGQLEVPPEVWDARRVAELDDLLASTGTVPLHAVARHRASGELAGYTALWIRQGKTEIADQDDTLVLEGHRGHGLGLRLKLANLAAYRRRFPEARKVTTLNAAENAHMLAINLAMGFQLAGYDGEWQRQV